MQTHMKVPMLLCWSSKGSYYKITNTKFFRPSIKVSRNSAAITPLSTKSIAAVTAPIRNLDKVLAAKCIRISLLLR